MPKVSPEDIGRKLTPMERVERFFARYRDAKGRPPLFVPSSYTEPPPAAPPEPAPLEVPDDELDHGCADRGRPLKEKDPPLAPKTYIAPIQGGMIVNQDGTVHGGAFEEGHEPLPGPVNPVTRKPQIVNEQGDPLEDVEDEKTPKRQWGPAPGDRVAW